MEKEIKLTDAERVCFKESVAMRPKQSDKWTRITLCGTNYARNKVFCLAALSVRSCAPKHHKKTPLSGSFFMVGAAGIEPATPTV